MPAVNELVLVAGATVVFARVPGPAVISIVTRSIDQSRLTGIVSGLGIGAGNLVYVGAVALGLSAVLASSTLAYDTVRYLGAAYLVYLGVRKLIDRPTQESMGTARRQPSPSVYREGLVVALLNPKAALFFLAFLPQFVDRSQGPIALRIALLGLVVVVITIVSDSCYAILSGTVAQGLFRSPRLVRGQQIFAGGVYVALGLFAALAGSGSARK